MPMVAPGKGVHQMEEWKRVKRIVTATVRNQSGVLNRITGVMTRRHFNIEKFQ